MKKNPTLWQCRCGRRFRLSEEQIKSRQEVCPNCGTVVDESSGFEYIPSADDTQKVDIDEMARMAQEGIDVTVSGEWDTRSKSKPSRGLGKEE